MAERKKSKSANPVLYWKPNQFPASRFGNIRWNDKCKLSNVTEEEDSDEGDGTNNAGRNIEDLKHRFDNPSCDCPDGPKRQGE